MPIGDQEFGHMKLTEADLKSRYDDLIKEAILRADPSLDVSRADEVSTPGSLTTDILTRIMYSDIVVADVTYPNPNVFYELGLRHACRIGTIIIRDQNGPEIPFDIAHLRYIEYEYTVTGLKSLAQKFKNIFDHFEHNSDKPDNHFLELARFTNYAFPTFGEFDTHAAQLAKMFKDSMQSQDMLYLMTRMACGDSVTMKDILSVFTGGSVITEIMDRDKNEIIEEMKKKLLESLADNPTKPMITDTKELDTEQ